MLTAGADPLEWESVDQLKKRNHPNWRYAAICLRTLCHEVCTGEVKCIDVFVEEWDSYGNRMREHIELLNLTMAHAEQIDVSATRLTRKSLYDWYKRKGLMPDTAHSQQVAHRKGMVIDALPVEPQIVTATTSAPLLPPPYLDPHNPLSPPELRVAAEAWHAITAQGDPRERGQGVHDALVRWITENKTELQERHKVRLGTKAVERIAIVTNWNKAGGAAPTPGK